MGAGATGGRHARNGLAKAPVLLGSNGQRHQALELAMAPVIPVPASAVHSGSTAPETALPQTPVPQTPVPPGARRRWTRLTRMPWPLLAVLAAQSGLSLRLIWSNTA